MFCPRGDIRLNPISAEKPRLLQGWTLHRAAGAAAGGVAVLLLLAPTLLYPLTRDQWTFAFVARTILSGGRPYLDAWDVKPPGIYLIYAALLARSGLEPDAVRFAVLTGSLVAACCTALLLALLAARWADPRAAFPAAIWWAALFLQGGAGGATIASAWGMAQAETFSMPLVLLGLLLLHRQSRRACFFAGILVGLAAWLKWPLLLLGCVPLLTPGLRRGLRISAYLSGAGLSLLLPLLFFQLLGWLTPLLEIQMLWVRSYAAVGGIRPLDVVYASGRWMLAVWPAWAAAAALALRRRSEDPPALAAALLLTGLVIVLVQQKFFGYHWQAALPGLALLAAAGSLRLAGLYPRALRWVWALPLLAAVQLAGAVYLPLLGILPSSAGDPQWLAKFGRPGRGDYSPLATHSAGARLRTSTEQGSGLLVWGFEPALYFASGQPAPTRFFFNTPLTAAYCPPAWRAEFIRSIRMNPPARMVVMQNDAVPHAGGSSLDSAAFLAQWPALASWLKENYELYDQQEDFSFYRRRK